MNATSNSTANTTSNSTVNATGNTSANATQYDKPINSERAEPWETSTHDIVYYKPNKYYAQKNVSLNATANVTANTSSNASSNATQYDKPINSERQEPFETSTHDINYYKPNKYYGQVN